MCRTHIQFGSDSMNLNRRVVGLLQKVDLFKSPVKLLYDKRQYGSLCGGFMSLFFMGILILVFLPTIQTFFTFEAFSVQISEFNKSPQPLTTFTNKTFSFAVMLAGYNGTKKSHDIYFTEWESARDPEGNQLQQRYTRYLGVPCNTSFWTEAYGDKVAQALKTYELTDGLICNPPELNMSMYGRYSTNITALQVSIERCYSQDCLTDQQIIEENVSEFYPQVFFPQTTFNYYSSRPVQLYLQEELWYYSRSNPFSHKAFDVLFSDVIIDDSQVDIWPTSIPFFHNTSNVYKGFLVDKFYQTDEIHSDDILALWRFRKSAKTIVVSRSIDKIDDLLSYIGGCLGILLVLGEVIKAYNEKLMFLQMGASIRFESEGRSEQPLFKSFSFLDFVQLSFKQLFGRGRQLSPQDLNYIEKAQYVVDNTEKLLSINHLCKRLRKCEILLECIAGEHSLNLITLHNEKAVALDREEKLAQLIEEVGSLQPKDGPIAQQVPLHYFDQVRDSVKNELQKRHYLPTSLAGFSAGEGDQMAEDVNLIIKGLYVQNHMPQ